MIKTNLYSIQNALENIDNDLDNAIDEQEAHAPDHMDFSKMRDAQKELKEQAEYLRLWMHNFDIGDIDQRTF
jgi:hypothetical protein